MWQTGLLNNSVGYIFYILFLCFNVIYRPCATNYMSRMSKHVVTANRLSDGAVVYLQSDGSFGEDVHGSQTADEDQTENLMEKAGDAVASQEIVAPYVIDVEVNGGSVTPTRYREKVRAGGPTTPFGPEE